MDYELLLTTELFKTFSKEELISLLQQFDSKEKTFKKNTLILKEGNTTKNVCIILSGSACLENIDFWGHNTIIDYIEKGKVFAETYATISDEELMVNVRANENSTVFFINISPLFDRNPIKDEHLSNKLIKNLLSISARKNLYLTRKIIQTAGKSIREKLISYLSFQAQKNDSYEFDIPFDRQQLADYLGVERSAMAAQISKMQKENLLSVKRNHFCLKRDEF